MLYVVPYMMYYVALDIHIVHITLYHFYVLHYIYLTINNSISGQAITWHISSLLWYRPLLHAMLILQYFSKISHMQLFSSD